MIWRILLFSGLMLPLPPALAQSFTVADPARIALFPQQNDLRNTLNLSGIWRFRKDSLDVGEKENWQNGLTQTSPGEVRAIAVPGSWNEQFADSRDYLGLAWYETETFVPSSWKGAGQSGQRIWVRVGAASYAAKLWFNGQPVGQHEGGQVPFAFDVSSLVRWGETNRLTIQVENNLKPGRVPTGNVQGGPFTNFPKTNYDFFPYAGLHRDVWLYSVPAVASIRDVTVKTDFMGTTGQVDVQVETEGKTTAGSVLISGNRQTYKAPIRRTGNRLMAQISIPNVRLWSPDAPYLYTVEVTLGDEKKPVDRYRLETGIRTISTTENQLLLNGKPIFLKGFGRHEDFPVFGRGTANPVIVKDFALMKWTGANSFRTSHYPYDEEQMRMADREGFLVIDEIPAVGLFFHGDTTELAQRQAMCKQYINELIARDKNHPSVIMWCVANEPFPRNISVTGGPGDREATPKSIALFKELFAQVKQNDPTRLATLVGVMGGPAEWVGLGDVLCLNRYYGWYTHMGDMAGAMKLLALEADALHKRFRKPVIFTEFGADTYPGTHSVEPEMYTEEFQTNYLKAYLDFAASRDYVTGMHVWAFADFKTSQALIRFGGINYKGVFTRDRKPKQAAFYLQSRWKKP